MNFESCKVGTWTPTQRPISTVAFEVGLLFYRNLVYHRMQHKIVIIQSFIIHYITFSHYLRNGVKWLSPNYTVLFFLVEAVPEKCIAEAHK